MPGRQSPRNGHKRPAQANKKTRASSYRASTQEQREPARSPLASAAEAVSHVVSLESQTRTALEEQRRSVTERVHKVRNALRSASQVARGEHEAFANYLERAGQTADEVAQYISNADLRRMRSDAERLARSNPGWFVGGALVAGLVLGRLLKASGPSLLPTSVSPSESS